jgi:ethanolamine utilization protein EutP
MVNREAIGIITGIDKPDANVERVRRWLQLAGCKKIFPVSSITGEGIKELAEYLEDDEDRARRKEQEALQAKKTAPKPKKAGAGTRS